MAVFLDPVPPDPPHDPAQEMAGQMRHPHPGQDEEAGIVGHEGEVGGSGGRVPANKAVSRCGGPCGGPEEEAGQILSGAIPNQVLEVFSDRSGEPEVVIVVQIISHTTGFVGLGGRKMNRQGRQGLERRVEGPSVRGEKPLSERWEKGASSGNTNRGQRQEPALLEFVDHAAGSKGFQVSGRGLPAPVPAKMLGDLMSAPGRVCTNQIAQPGKIRLGKATTLTCNGFIHGMIMP